MRRLFSLAVLAFASACAPGTVRVAVLGHDVGSRVETAIYDAGEVLDVDFVVVGVDDDPHVTVNIVLGYPAEHYSGTTDYGPRDCSRAVAIGSDVPDELVGPIVAHELGHVGGLGHTDDTVMGDVGFFAWEMTADQRDELQRGYARLTRCR